jgi:hypothetical protein
MADDDLTEGQMLLPTREREVMFLVAHHPHGVPRGT